MANPFKKPKMPKIEIPKPDPVRFQDNTVALAQAERDAEEERRRKGGRLSTVLWRPPVGPTRTLGT